MFFYYFYAIFGPVVMVVFLFSMKFFFEDEVDALFCKDRAALNRSRTLSLSVREFEMKKTKERRSSASLREERLSDGNFNVNAYFFFLFFNKVFFPLAAIQKKDNNETLWLLRCA